MIIDRKREENLLRELREKNNADLKEFLICQRYLVYDFRHQELLLSIQMEIAI